MVGQGAASGGWVGALVGIIGGPVGVIAGGALGAAAGGLFAKLHDVGINDDEMKEMGERLDRGQAALFVLLKSYDVTAVAMELRRFEGALFHSNADEAIQTTIRRRARLRRDRRILITRARPHLGSEDAGLFRYAIRVR